MQYTSNPKIGGGGFAGKIDEVHVRSAFPTAFILEGNTAKRTSTLGLWHFNTGSGTTESDDDYTGEQQTATLPSSGCWTNASGEIYPARYEYIYTYDKVGNRTAKYEFFVTGSPGVGSGQKWTYSYNGLNQLTQQNKYSTDGLTLDRKWLYTYDANGNQTTKEKQTSGSVKEEKWVYSWNPRNQMSLAEKFTGTNDTYAGKVVYRSCLSCDSVLSERIEYSPTVSTTIVKWWRYEYDGLNCLRLDEKYDTAGGALDANDPWRTIEVNTHKPGSLGALICKRVYTHTNNDATPDQTNDYTYTYDAVGNVIAVYNANVTNRGNELYYFTQDAFGNELTTSPFNGSPWSTARTAGITEHQTGKWIDPFTGLYFFHARWYDSTVGRFVGRDEHHKERSDVYTFCFSNPLLFVDVDGKNGDCLGCAPIIIPDPDGETNLFCPYTPPTSIPPLPNPIVFPINPRVVIFDVTLEKKDLCCSLCDISMTDRFLCSVSCFAKNFGLPDQGDFAKGVWKGLIKSSAKFCRQAAKKIVPIIGTINLISDSIDSGICTYRCMMME